MSTSKSAIRSWLQRGAEMGATHVIVICDTYDHEDYPSYILPGQSVHKKVGCYDSASMQRVMEVYNLAMNIEEQLDEVRAWHL